jgi:hypothetical protein
VLISSKECSTGDILRGGIRNKVEMAKGKRWSCGVVVRRLVTCGETLSLSSQRAPLSFVCHSSSSSAFANCLEFFMGSMSVQFVNAAQSSASAHRSGGVDRVRSRLPLFLSRLSWGDLPLASHQKTAANEHEIIYFRAIEKMAPIARLQGFDFCRAFVSCFDCRCCAYTCAKQEYS